MSKYPTTPLPWVREQVQDGEYTGPGDTPPGYAGDWYEANGVGHREPDTGEWVPVADCTRGSDAALIVRAVNAHGDMLSALTDLHNYLTPGTDPILDGFLTAAAKAIQKAHGEQT